MKRNLRAQIRALVQTYTAEMLVALRNATLQEFETELRTPRARLHNPAKNLPRNPERRLQLFQKALEWQQELKKGRITNRAAIARREGLSRARVTQIMSVLRDRS
jgi:hypothetical protein